MELQVIPAEFLRGVQHDYEQQWRRAQGHAQRHPLRIKMDRLEEVVGRAFTVDEFEQFLAESIVGDDLELSLLSVDLETRWRLARRAS